MDKFNKIEEALNDFRKGKLIIVVDDKKRENEGDLVCAAQKVTPQIINFLTKFGRGLICAPINQSIATKFKLPLMIQNNTEKNNCKFTVSVDCNIGTTTGISAFDRSKTIKALSSNKSKFDDFCRPGHVFPIIVEKDGLKKRKGHTEAVIELCKLCKFQEAGVICEILRDDGRMANNNDLFEFASFHKLKIISINDLLKIL